MAPSVRAMALASTLALAARSLAQGNRFAELIQSAAGTGDLLSSKGSVELVPDFGFEGVTVSLSKQEDQEIQGFGGAFTEAAAMVFQGLPEAEQRRLLDMYWGEGGIGLTMGRAHINSCDFSPKYWTFDDVEGDFELEFFDTNVTHDTVAMIPFIQAAQQTLHSSSGQELKIIAAPWSPPAWMKTNGQMLGSGEPGLKATCKATWAKYFSKWISAYKAHGIPIWAVTPQNEAENAGIWESCVYTAQQELDFIAEELGPTLRADHPEVQLLIFDHNKDHVLEWAEALYAHPGALQYTQGVAFHWYTGDEFDHVAEVHRRFPDALLLSTEATYDQSRLHGEHTMTKGNWSFGLGYAHDIIGDLNAGSAGWLDWNLVLDANGGPNKVGNNCDAPMISDGEHLYVHPQYYALGHFSKYILPGSKRLETVVLGSQRHTAARPYGTCDGRDGLEATAFLRPDGLTAVVVLNCGDVEVSFKLQDGVEALKASIPAQGIQTYLLDRAAIEIFA